MNNWNKIAYGKTAFVMLFAIFGFFTPFDGGPLGVGVLIRATLGATLSWIVFGILIIYLVTKFFGGAITAPNWNGNPIKLRQPVILLQAAAIVSFAHGISNILGGLFSFGSVPIFGLQNLFTGIGIFVSIKLSARIFRSSQGPN